MKVRCKVCGEWFEKENIYCDHCAAKYGAERSQYDIDLFEDQRSFSKEDQAKQDQKKQKKSTKKATVKEKKIPDFDTMRDLRPPSRNEENGQGKKRTFKGTFRSIIFFFVFINIITGVLSDMDFDDLIEEFIGGDDGAVYYEEEAVTVEEDWIKENFPINEIDDYYGTTTIVGDTPIGIYEGTLSTATYLNFDNKDMRFDIKDTDYSGVYELPIFMTISGSAEDDNYYVDVWDQYTLKTLGTYLIPTANFTGQNQGAFEGEMTLSLYDEADNKEIKASYVEEVIEGRLGLPYTVQGDVNYFNFDVIKINDDINDLMARTYLQNEYSETFISDDGQFTIDFYTYETPQGYPHSSMYFDGVFVITDGEEGYPPMPFNLSEYDDLYADMSYLDSGHLSIMDKDFSEYYYYDDMDTQFYRYYPIEYNDSIYDLELSGTVYVEGDATKIDGLFRIYNHYDGSEDFSKEFTVTYVE